MEGSKAGIRKAAQQRRNAVEPTVREAFGTRLATLGLQLVRDFAPVSQNLVVALYQPINREALTLPLVQALVAADVPVAMPVTFSHGGALVFRLWAPQDPLAPGALGIPEPLPDAPEVDPDVLFVPLVAFDRRGHRVGYGAGHYDRTLEALRAVKHVRAIGVAFSVQEELFVPAEAHDQPLDLVVTERDVLICAN